jgi:2-oxo-4-hydroxy-4-carboxy-5-ureidoimidazoline decarboxylase
MSEVLERWNRLSAEEAEQEILACCGSKGWARAVAAQRPLKDEASLVAVADETWWNLGTADWVEAFDTHPRIGERKAPLFASAQSVTWSAQEQRNVAAAGDAIQLALAEGNREYERRFNRVLIVCVTGKSAPEILEILQRRLRNDDATELRESAEEQRKITYIRLKKWLWG